VELKHLNSTKIRKTYQLKRGLDTPSFLRYYIEVVHFKENQPNIWVVLIVVMTTIPGANITKIESKRIILRSILGVRIMILFLAKRVKRNLTLPLLNIMRRIGTDE